jgi:hypothetical protein
MKIEILNRTQVNQIDLEQWQQLSNDSIYINPFYEPWCLIPALRHLDPQKEVYIVAVYDNGTLTALFPVFLKSHRLFIRCVAIWKHSQCFLSNPLCLEETPLAEIICYVAKKLSATIFQIKDHTPFFSVHTINLPNVIIRTTRGAIFITREIEEHLKLLPKKLRSENKRIKNRLLKECDATYQTSRSLPSIDWLDTYCKLEDSGWKRQQKSSIYSNPEVRCYYSEMSEDAMKFGKIEFQGLFSGYTTLASSFRIASRNCAFELKTSYNEKFRRYYPGAVLELINLEAIDAQSYVFVDSCTNPGNRLVNRLWPARMDIWNSFYFPNIISGTILRTILGAIFAIRSFFGRES